MHIAICDDNMADRKQLERLLERESDKRASTTGILYTYSFGNCKPLLSNCMQYDAFYIDICKTEGITGIDVVTQLIEIGVNAPIVLCSSDINYRTYPLPANVIFLDKPIKIPELSESIEHALQIKKQAEPLIELREDKETFHVKESDILYAVEDGRHVTVTLSNGRKIHVVTNIINLFAEIENHPTFLAPSKKYIINARHIHKFGISKVIMVDDAVFKIHGKYMRCAKEIHAIYSSK